MPRQQPWISRRFRMNILRAGLLLILLLGLFTASSWSDNAVADFAAEWLGYVLLVGGLGIRLWSTLYIGGRKSKELVTAGPYSLCRKDRKSTRLNSSH